MIRLTSQNASIRDHLESFQRYLLRPHSRPFIETLGGRGQRQERLRPPRRLQCAAEVDRHHFRNCSGRCWEDRRRSRETRQKQLPPLSGDSKGWPETVRIGVQSPGRGTWDGSCACEGDGYVPEHRSRACKWASWS